MYRNSFLLVLLMGFGMGTAWAAQPMLRIPEAPPENIAPVAISDQGSAAKLAELQTQKAIYKERLDIATLLVKIQKMQQELMSLVPPPPDEDDPADAPPPAKGSAAGAGRPSADVDDAPPPPPVILPMVTGVTGFSGRLSAELTYPDGGHVRVKAGSHLPQIDAVVVSVSASDGVRIRIGDQVQALKYQDAPIAAPSTSMYRMPGRVRAAVEPPPVRSDSAESAPR